MHIKQADVYMCLFWAFGAPTWYEAFRASGSSLFTLGFAPVDDLPKLALMLSEAAIGLILVALLIAYLPTMYAAFSRREAAVTLLQVRAGSPPSAVELIERFYRNHGLEHLNEMWQAWEVWFAEFDAAYDQLAHQGIQVRADREQCWRDFCRLAREL